MVLGGKWLSGELVELGLQGLGTFERNDLGFKAGTLGRGQSV